jgi:hypothetical protein
MNIHYKIVEVWPDDHLIVARYWTDVISEEFLASSDQRAEDGSPARCRTDVSLSVAIPAPSEEEMEKFILHNAPVYFLKTLEDVKNPEVDTSMTHILALKGKKFTTENAETILIKAFHGGKEELSEEEIQKLIDQVSSI